MSTFNNAGVSRKNIGMDTISCYDDQNAETENCISVHESVLPRLGNAKQVIVWSNGRQLTLKLLKLQQEEVKVRKKTCIKISKASLSALGLSIQDGKRACYADAKLIPVKEVELPTSKKLAKSSDQDQLPTFEFGNKQSSKLMPSVVESIESYSEVKVRKRKIAKKPKAYQKTYGTVLGHLPQDKESIDLVRLHPKVMANFDRNEIVIFDNLSTGIKTFARVQGSAGTENLRSENACRASYEIRAKVSYQEGDALQIRKATRFQKFRSKFVGDSQYSYQAYLVGALGTVVGLAGLVIGLIG